MATSSAASSWHWWCSHLGSVKWDYAAHRLPGLRVSQLPRAKSCVRLDETMGSCGMRRHMPGLQAFIYKCTHLEGRRPTRQGLCKASRTRTVLNLLNSRR